MPDEPVIAPVVVVGAGPVGLTAALLLGRRGIPVTVLERHPEPYPLPRAVHLDGECLRILQEAGVADAVLAISGPMAGLRLLDGRLRVLAEFARRPDAGDQGWPAGVLFRQPELEEVLRAAVAETPSIALRTGAEATGLRRDGERLLVAVRDGVGEREVGASFVLGCDGANSVVRGWIGARMRNLGRPDRWLVLDARRPGTLPVWPGVHQISDPHRAATFIPISGDRLRWEFRLLPGETVADLTAPDRLAALLAPFGVDGDLEVERAAEYLYRAQVADRWRQGRVLLAGDAAHLSPPFIGQGLGLGLRDVHQLAWKLAGVLTGRDGSGRDEEVLLDTYQSEREPHAVALIRTARLLERLMTRGGRGASVLRRGVLAVVRRLPVTAALAATSRTPRLTAGPLVDRRGRPGRPGRRLAGSLLPQPEVLVDGEACRLDDVLGPGWAELRLSEDRLLVRSDGGHERELVDPSGTLAARLRSAGASAVRIRPDRIVGSARA